MATAEVDSMNSHARLAIAASFFITSVLGASLIFVSLAAQSMAIAAVRSTLFLMVMGCVHIAGYLLYVQQFAASTSETVPDRSSFTFSDAYWPALKVAVILQAVLGILTALMLDGGRSFVFFEVAFVGHWIGILLIMGRRPLTPTRFDLIYVRYGVIINLVLAGIIAPAVWSLIGESTLSGWERLQGR